jgi:hypothetical protein
MDAIPPNPAPKETKPPAKPPSLRERRGLMGGEILRISRKQ